MSESDRASIHEAMEQQTISMAKAGMVCKLMTRCAILAAANPKNISSNRPDRENTLSIGIASPLLSRFDLVFILNDARDAEWDAEVADHLLAAVSVNANQRKIATSNLWSAERLQAHFIATRNYQPKLSDEANLILGSYYKKCRSDSQRDPGRTTIRLLDSLNRLAQAHARLLFRRNVTAADAAIVVRLMESSYGFGRILPPFDLNKEEFPLGPSNEDINDVLSALDLDGLQVTRTIDEEPKKHISEEIEIKSQTRQEESRQNSRPLRSQVESKELDEILGFEFDDDDEAPAKYSKPNVTSSQTSKDLFLTDDDPSDSDDLILSQVLDQVESSQNIPERPQLNLNQFEFDERKRMELKRSQIASSIASEIHSQELSESCNAEQAEKRKQDSSDASQSAKRKTIASTTTKMNAFENIENVAVNTSAENDSAYSSFKQPTVPSSTATSKTKSKSRLLSQLEECDDLDFLEI